MVEFNPYDKQIDWIRSMEKMHQQFLSAKKKKEFCIKKVYQSKLETHLLYSRGDIFIFAVIDKSGTEREALDIGKQILADAKEIESTSFIVRHV